MSDRVVPRPVDVGKAVELIEDGFSIVGLYRFAFFAMPKQTIATVGYMDENYIGGNYEDNDFIWRIKEAGLSYYEAEEVPYYRSGRSTWHTRSQSYYKSKWRISAGSVTRLASEPPPPYPLPVGYNERKQRPWSESVILAKNLNALSIPISSEVST
jgi:hypothetical protein